MPIRQGREVGAVLDSGQFCPYITSDLALYEFVPYSPAAYYVGEVAGLDNGRALRQRVRMFGVARAAYRASNYTDDFYYRIHIKPRRLDLGNITSSQTSNVAVWNAWLEPRLLQSIDIIDGDGISVTGPGGVPQSYAALAEKVWQVAVSTDGTSVLDARVVWNFDIGDAEVAVTANRIVPWPIAPDWTNGVRERLAWLTEALRARNGRTQKRRLRQAPRRGIEFDVVTAGRDRRFIDNLLFDWSSRIWALPIWHDQQRLATAVPAGAVFVPCVTAGYDFAVGRLVMLWADAINNETLEVEAISAGALTLKRPTTRAWPAGTRLYPVRSARLEAWPEERAFHDDAGRQPVAFSIDEPCDWPAVMPAATYRGRPVLESRPDESDDPTRSYDRVLDLIDTQTGGVVPIDWSGRPYRNASHRWMIAGRAANASLRSLLYALAGQYRELWVPSWSSDLVLAAAVPPAGLSITVNWCGYARHGRMQANRRDIRVELKDGTISYRRIMGATETGTATEALAIDAAFGREVTPAQVRLISFMTLAEQASDEVELLHVTDADGATRAATSFRAVAHDD